jgi:hypothetical protein
MKSLGACTMPTRGPDSLTCLLQPKSFPNTPRDLFGMNWAFGFDRH